MRRKTSILAIGALALFLLFLAPVSDTGANSTGGASMTMCMDCHILPKGAEIHAEWDRC